jgi:predicted HTH transcriptional regulator
MKSLAEQVQRLEKKVEREHLILAPLPGHAFIIIELAREHGRVTMADAIQATGSNRNTLKEHIRKLIQDGRLVKHGEGRGAWYRLS